MPTVPADQAADAVREFRGEPLLAVIAHLQARLAAGAEVIRLRALDPDRGAGRYAGELVDVGGVAHVHRGLRVWVDLAERLGLRLRTPRAGADPALVELTFERLAGVAPGAGAAAGDVTERYGAASDFARIHKLEDPGFVLDVALALDRIALPPAPRILDLGVNTGDELALLLALRPALATATLVGVDHSASALAVARARFPAARLVQADLADLPALAALDLGRFDLVLSIGTLQSGGLDDRALLRQVVQAHLAPTGAVLLGLPCCRYQDGEVVHGARMKNYREAEHGLLVKDVAFYRKYLQQHHRRVHVTGKHYVLVTAVPAASPSPAADRP